jgi:hypothetical protein
VTRSRFVISTGSPSGGGRSNSFHLCNDLAVAAATVIRKR